MNVPNADSPVSRKERINLNSAAPGWKTYETAHLLRFAGFESSHELRDHGGRREVIARDGEVLHSRLVLHETVSPET